MTYQEFRKSHSGKGRSEISTLWTIYKESAVNEVKRDPKEQAMLNRLNVKKERSLGIRTILY